MRVISGEARGRPLVGPIGSRTRPTTDKVKGALYSMLETLLAADPPGGATGEARIEPGGEEVWLGLSVADLYAGTGALGIEALSRGAVWCDFVDADSAARRVIERNLANTGFTNRARVIGVDLRKVVGRAAVAFPGAPYGLVLVDPPYADPAVESVVGRLASGAWLIPDALVAVEHSRRLPLAPIINLATGPTGDTSDLALVEVRQRRHGDTILSIYRWTTPGDRGVDEHGDDGDLPG